MRYNIIALSLLGSIRTLAGYNIAAAALSVNGGKLFGCVSDICLIFVDRSLVLVSYADGQIYNTDSALGCNNSQQ